MLCSQAPLFNGTSLYLPLQELPLFLLLFLFGAAIQLYMYVYKPRSIEDLLPLPPQRLDILFKLVPEPNKDPLIKVRFRLQRLKRSREESAPKREVEEEEGGGRERLAPSFRE